MLAKDIVYCGNMTAHVNRVAVENTRGFCIKCVRTYRLTSRWAVKFLGSPLACNIDEVQIIQKSFLRISPKKKTKSISNKALKNIAIYIYIYRMRWAGHVARMGEGRVVHRGNIFPLWGNLREREFWGDPDVDGRIILRWIFGKLEGVDTGWSWLRIGTDGGHL